MTTVPFYQNPQAVRRFTRFSRVAGLLLVGAGLAVLAGWWWGVPLLTGVVPGLRTMKANAAIAFVLSGAALLLSQRPDRARRRVAQWLSWVVVALGAASLAEYVWSVDLGIDHLFDDPDSPRMGMPAGRMAAHVALAFILLGAQGALVSARRFICLREGLGIGVLAIAMIGMVSYGFILAGQRNLVFDHVPIHTTMLLFLAALGWMASVPATGLTRVATADTLGGTFARRLLLPALLLPVVFSFMFKAVQSWLQVSEVFAFTLATLFTGGTVSWLVWWLAALLDKVERQRREFALLRDRANTDALTGLPNRRAFDDTLDNLQQGRRGQEPVFSLLMLDLDRFKLYNDAFGHQAGDEALRITGQILRSALRGPDLAARYGGEEFALLMPDTDGRRAHDVAMRIIHEFRAFPWPQRQVTVSIGVAEARAGESAQALIERADAALYEAKHAGRDRAVLATGVVAPGPA